MNTIIQKRKRCFKCGTPYVEDHHIFFGTANRKLSEKYGLKLWLCPKHHRTGPEAPHRNREVDLEYKELGQMVFEENHTREEFRNIFGKNHLWGDEMDMDQMITAFLEEIDKIKKDIQLNCNEAALIRINYLERELKEKLKEEEN